MKQTLFCLVVLAALSACTPLHQAPLVYSSKISVGVDLSAAMTESPGVSIALGYKQVDAAYVPVAVAKPCPETGDRCLNPMYELKLLKGSNVEGSGDKENEERLAQAKQLLEDVKKASLALDNRRSTEKLALQSAKAADEEVKQLTAELKAQKDTARIAALNSSDIPQATSKANSARQVLSMAQRATASAKAVVDAFNVDQIATATRIVANADRKGDAYSVFGSFDGNTRSNLTTSANSSTQGEASLVVGKVFSTGVASQLLTQGMRDYYANMAAERVAAKVVDCLKTVLSVDELKTDPSRLQTAMDMCNGLRMSVK